MLSLKYAREYRLDTFTDESGKVKDCTVYVGPLYEWAVSEDVVKGLGKRFSMITFLQGILFISSLWGYSDLSRLWWVVVPYCCLLFVFLYFAAACYNLFTVTGQFHREKKDKTVDRVKGCSVMGCVLAAISFVSATFSIFNRLVQFGVYDLWLMAVQTLLIVSFLYEMKLAKGLQVRELVNPKAAEWKDK